MGTGGAAKLARPAVPGAYRRRRLFAILDDARRAGSAVWVAGPAGSGKTTLVASYLEARDFTCIWYQVDAGDVDATSFFHQLGLAAREAAPRFRRALPRLTPEYFADVRTFTRNYFREVYRRLRGPFALVLDNVQEASSSRFQDIICTALEEMPRAGQAVVISRAEAPEAFARMRANRRFVEIGWPDLRLREDESRSVVRSLAGPKHSISRRELQALHWRCEGWVAGLILSIGLPVGQDRPSKRFTLDAKTPQALFDYFAAEVFTRRSAAVRQFLMQTALLPTFTLQMVERLTRDAHSHTYLDDLVRHHHFTERKTESIETYQYHALFRDFLIEQGKTRWNAAECARNRRRAAKVLEEAGQLEHALTLFLALGDTKAAERLILAQAAELTGAGRFEALSAAISRLPVAVVDRHGWLLYWAGVCRLPFDVLESRRLLESAFARFESDDNWDGMLMTVAQIVESYFYELGDFEPLDRWIGILDDMTSGAGDGPSSGRSIPPSLEAVVAMTMFTALMYRQPQRSDIDAWVERAFSAMLVTNEVQPKMLLGFHLLFYFTCWRGDLARAEIVIDALRPAGASRTVAPFARIMWHTVEAFYDWISGHFSRAVQSAQSGLAVAADAGVHGWDVMLFMAAACASLGLNRLTDAEEFVERMNGALVPSQTFNACLCQDLLGIVALWCHNAPRAREQAKISGALAEQSGTAFARAMCGITRALAEGECGNHAEALAHLRSSQGIGSAMRSRYIDYLCRLAEARLALEQQLDMSRVVESLRPALTAGREGGFYHHLWMPCDVIGPLCSLALAHGVEVDYARELVRRRRLTPADSAVVVERWPFAVKIYTLGTFEVRIQDSALRFSTKAQKKPLELLKALVSLGGRGVSQDALADALWPTADADRAAGACTTTVHRLRKLIGADAVEYRGGSVSLNPSHCWVDAWVVEQGLVKLESVSSPRTAEDWVSAIDGLLRVYRGPFLPGDGQLYAVVMRERLRSRLLRVLRSTSELLMQAERHQEAARCLEKALDLDPLAEEMYRRLMQSYLARGHRAEALSAYERCRKTLAVHSGLRPSPDTEAMRRRIQAASGDLNP